MERTWLDLAVGVVGVLGFLLAVGLAIREVTAKPRLKFYPMWRFNMDSRRVDGLLLAAVNHGRRPGTILDMWFCLNEADKEGLTPTKQLRDLLPMTIAGLSAYRFEVPAGDHLEARPWLRVELVGSRGRRTQLLKLPDPDAAVRKSPFFTD